MDLPPATRWPNSSEMVSKNFLSRVVPTCVAGAFKKAAQQVKLVMAQPFNQSSSRRTGVLDEPPVDNTSDTHTLFGQSLE